MHRYISILRGINVSGKNKIRMEELEKTYSKLMAYTQEHNIPVNYNAWEMYINDPMKVRYPVLCKTEIYFEVEE